MVSLKEVFCFRILPPAISNGFLPFKKWPKVCASDFESSFEALAKDSAATAWKFIKRKYILLSKNTELQESQFSAKTTGFTHKLVHTNYKCVQMKNCGFEVSRIWLVKKRKQSLKVYTEILFLHGPQIEFDWQILHKIRYVKLNSTLRNALGYV